MPTLRARRNVPTDLGIEEMSKNRCVTKRVGEHKRSRHGFFEMWRVARWGAAQPADKSRNDTTWNVERFDMSQTERAVHALATFVERARDAQAQSLDFPEEAIDAIAMFGDTFSEAAARRVITLLTEAADYARLSGFHTPDSDDSDAEALRIQLRIVELLGDVRVAPDAAVPWITKVLERHVVVPDDEADDEQRIINPQEDAEDRLVIAALNAIARYRAAAAPALDIVDTAREHREREARVLARDVGDAIRYWAEAS
jgi:hypothetical protein